MRISRQQMFMEMAHVAAKRSTCYRGGVGCVIVANKRVVSIGYNGHKSGEPHCTGNECPGNIPGNCPVIHAEVNALTHLPQTVSGYLDLYTTLSPCKFCLELVLHYPVRRIFMGALYRETTHLHSSKSELYRITPSGYVVDWRTGRVIDDHELTD